MSHELAPLKVIQGQEDSAQSSAAPHISLTPFRWRDPASIPPRDILYGREIERGTSTVVVAPGGIGKTSFLAGTAMALASGRNLLGREVRGGPHRIALWNLEDPITEIERLLHAVAIHYSISADDIHDRLFVDSAMDGAGLNITRQTREGIAIAEPIIDALVDELVRRRIDVLVVDPFVSCHSAPENDNSAIDAIAKAWNRVASRARCAIVLVHHAKKLGGGEVTAESSRGAVSLPDAARLVLTLNQMTKEEAAKLGMEGLQHRRYFRVSPDKLNRAPPVEKADWYHLASVDLGNGDSVQCVEPWSPPDAFEGVTTAKLYEVQKVVDEGDYRKSPQSNDWAGNAIAEVLGLDATDKLNRARINRMLSEWLANGVLREEQRKDRKGNLRPFIAVGRWAGTDLSSPPKSEVGNGEEVGEETPSPTPTPFIRGGVVGRDADTESRWGNPAHENNETTPAAIAPGGKQPN